MAKVLSNKAIVYAIKMIDIERIIRKRKENPHSIFSKFEEFYSFKE